MSKVADEKSEEKSSNEKEEFKGKPQLSVSKSETRRRFNTLHCIRFGTVDFKKIGLGESKSEKIF